MTKPLIFVVALIFMMPLTAIAQTFGAEEFALNNGMQVVVIPNHRAPVVTHMVWYKVGSADEQPGLSGMAHYLEHLLFKGTEKQTPGEFSRIVKTLGGNDNAFTSQDYTAYYQSIAVEHLERMMEMEADRMLNAKPPPEHFVSEKNVVLEERRQRTDNDPRAKFFEQLNSALFTNHPYSAPVIGWMNEIERYDWADVQKFYDTWYAPNNAILIVSGDVTADEVKKLAQKHYGSLPRKELLPRLRPQIPPLPAQTILTMRDPAIHQSMFVKQFVAPSYRMEKEDSLALQVLSDILDGGPTTRLYQKLVVDDKKAVSVNFGYSSSAYDYARFSMSAIPAENVTVEDIGAAMDAEITNILTNGVTETEVKDAIQRLNDQAVFARDSIAGPAMIFGNALTTGSSVSDIENWPDDIAKVTVERVNAAARKYLNESAPWIRPPVTGYLLPADKIIAPPKPETEAEAINVER